jgi:hypothetical protein
MVSGEGIHQLFMWLVSCPGMGTALVMAADQGTLASDSRAKARARQRRTQADRDFEPESAWIFLHLLRMRGDSDSYF